MNLFLDTSAFKAVLKLDEKTYEAELGREMAEKLLGFIEEKLKENNKSWSDIKSITFFSGPGSFTGLRIGAAVVNTLAHELDIPLYDHHGEKHEIILPDYGRPARITAPKK
ncbi:tRNA (adenosine(37)-N6)-threonylcarbamoyltransferase complex dimerization subunit type 1 TsaB [Candidatus Saccharibacteria bacterium]|nr:tRNA (adenosine(37)-N6)-threonylcarbamoyltransferase complex dimerization subunit type 1 TsaB [Candidatus Saccharibacteria bacterium]